MTSDEIKLFADTGTGVAHCPSANMRCGQGIAKIREMLDMGVNVGLGVDGSASNDTSNMFMEARLAMMLQRVAPNKYLSETPGGRGGFGGIAESAIGPRGADDGDTRRRQDSRP
jgi:cytosine/adenosine deaminase-related metal-dependent hydrolase